MVPRVLLNTQLEPRVELGPGVVVRVAVLVAEPPPAHALKVPVDADGRDHHKRVALAAEADGGVVDGRDGADGGEARAACAAAAVVADDGGIAVGRGGVVDGRGRALAAG